MNKIDAKFENKTIPINKSDTVLWNPKVQKNGTNKNTNFGYLAYFISNSEASIMSKKSTTSNIGYFIYKKLL